MKISRSFQQNLSWQNIVEVFRPKSHFIDKIIVLFYTAISLPPVNLTNTCNEKKKQESIIFLYFTMCDWLRFLRPSLDNWKKPMIQVTENFLRSIVANMVRLRAPDEVTIILARQREVTAQGEGTSTSSGWWIGGGLNSATILLAWKQWRFSSFQNKTF